MRREEQKGAAGGGEEPGDGVERVCGFCIQDGQGKLVEGFEGGRMW